MFYGFRFFYPRTQAEKTTDPVAKVEQVVQKAKQVVEKPKVRTVETTALKTQLDAIITANPNTIISVTYIDLDSGTKLTDGATTAITAASTNKLITAGTLLHRTETGTATLTKVLGSYPASWHLKQMINQSNNDSWAYLNTYLTKAGLGAYARSIGITTYDFYNNKIASYDLALLLQKLYKGTLLSDANRKLLLSYMISTNNENLIPAAIPDGVVVYHKYGNYGLNLHDASIITTTHPFVLVVMTSAQTSAAYANSTSIIHQAASAAYNFQLTQN